MGLGEVLESGRAVLRPLRAEGRTRESIAQLVAVASGGLTLLVGPFVFRGSGIPLSGQTSLATVTSVMTIVLGAVTFAVTYVRVARRSSAWMRRSVLWRVRDVAGLTLATTAVAVVAVAAAYNVFQRMFRGLVVGRVTATVLAAVTVGVLCYLLAVVAQQEMSTSRVAVLLGTFLIAGVAAATLSADDPGWWQSNFSALGISTETSATTFNFTVIIAGLILTALADYLATDLRSWPGVTRGRVVTIQVFLTVIGLGLIGLGSVPVDLSRVVHDICAVTVIVGFGSLILVTPVLLPDLPRPFLLTTFALGGLIVVVVLLWKGFHAFNFTAVELLSVLVIFAWLTLFARTVGTGPDPVVVVDGPSPLAVDSSAPAAVVTADGPAPSRGVSRRDPMVRAASAPSMLVAAGLGAVVGGLLVALLRRRAR